MQWAPPMPPRGSATTITRIVPRTSLLRCRDTGRVVLGALRRLAGPVLDPSTLGEAVPADRKRMTSEIEAFVEGLNRDLISADDFR